jgi:hypothetical protein
VLALARRPNRNRLRPDDRRRGLCGGQRSGGHERRRPERGRRDGCDGSSTVMDGAAVADLMRCLDARNRPGRADPERHCRELRRDRRRRQLPERGRTGPRRSTATEPGQQLGQRFAQR